MWRSRDGSLWPTINIIFRYLKCAIWIVLCHGDIVTSCKRSLGSVCILYIHSIIYFIINVYTWTLSVEYMEICTLEPFNSYCTIHTVKCLFVSICTFMYKLKQNHLNTFSRSWSCFLINKRCKCSLSDKYNSVYFCIFNVFYPLETSRCIPRALFNY